MITAKMLLDVFCEVEHDSYINWENGCSEGTFDGVILDGTFDFDKIAEALNSKLQAIGNLRRT